MLKPPDAEAFCETTHNICVKIQQTTVALTRVDILNDITSKIWGDITMDVPLHKYWGTCSYRKKLFKILILHLQFQQLYHLEK